MDTFAHHLGSFHIYWSRFDTYLEILCWRYTKTSARHAHMIFGPMQFGAKRTLADALLREVKPLNYELICSTIDRCVDLANRNFLAHSLVTVADGPEFGLWKREVKRELKVKARFFKAEEMRQHCHNFRDRVTDLERLSQFSPAEKREYAAPLGAELMWVDMQSQRAIADVLPKP